MFDYSLLRGLIYSKFCSLTKFAEAINKDINHVSLTLANKRRLKQDDIVLWANALDVKPEMIGELFFCLVGSQNANK